jgi:hypothetical protein
MCLFKFASRANVNHHDLAVSRFAQELIATRTVPLGARGSQLPQGVLQLKEPIFSEAAQQDPKARDFRAGNAVDNMLALALGIHESCRTQLLEMGAGELDADPRFTGERLDRLRGLAQQLDQLQSFRTGSRLGDAGDLLEQGVLDVSVCAHGRSLATLVSMRQLS